MEESSYTGLPTSHLLGSVPAVITEEDNNTTKHVDVVPGANMQIFPPTNGGDRGRGYQTLSSPTEAFEQQPTNNWRGVFSVSSYSQYFNVDTDDVVTRLISSLNPVGGDFFSKIDANPDLYGLIWISTTLVFVLASLGNLATFLMQKHADNSTSWSFDVSYMNMAACSIYGYAIVVPLAYYFFLQYMGSNASLIRFWCMWGYSLTIFIVSSVSFCFLQFANCIIIYTNNIAQIYFYSLVYMSSVGDVGLKEKLAGAVPQQSEALLHHRSKDLPDRTHIPNHASTIYKGWIKFLLIIPVEILRWLIILVTGVASASFVALNLRSYIDGNDLSVAIIAAFLLQIALAVFIKVWFFA